MHEFSLATEIVEAVTGFVKAQQPGTVDKVRLRIGEFTRIEAPQLRFCFNSLTRETVLSATTLEIEAVPAEVRCTFCHYQGGPKYAIGTPAAPAVPVFKCPRCGQATVAVRGHECEIKAIQTSALDPGLAAAQPEAARIR